MAPVKNYPKHRIEPEAVEVIDGPMKKSSDDYFEDHFWHEDVVTPPTKAAKVFQYDYTIGEDVTLPFRRDATTESILKVSETSTSIWTLPTTASTSTTTTTTTTPTTTTTSTTTPAESPNYGLKRIKKLSTRKPLLTRRPASVMERSTTTSTTREPTTLPDKRPSSKLYSLSTRRPIPTPASTSSTTTRRTTTTVATTTTTLTATTEFSYEKVSKTIPSLANRMRPKLGQSTVKFPALNHQDQGDYEKQFGNNLNGYKSADLEYPLQEDIVKTKSPFTFPELERPKAEQKFKPSFESMIDQEETPTVNKDKIAFPKSDFRLDKVRNRNEIVSEFESSKFPHFPVKKNADDDESGYDENVFEDEDNSYVHVDNYSKSNPIIRFENNQSPTKSLTKKETGNSEDSFKPASDKPEPEWSAKAPKLTPRPAKASINPSSGSSQQKIKLPSKAYHPEESGKVDGLTDYESDFLPQIRYEPFSADINKMQKPTAATTTTTTTASTTTSQPPNKWSSNAVDLSYDYTKGPKEHLQQKPIFDYDEYDNGNSFQSGPTGFMSTGQQTAFDNYEGSDKKPGGSSGGNYADFKMHSNSQFSQAKDVPNFMNFQSQLNGAKSTGGGTQRPFTNFVSNTNYNENKPKLALANHNEDFYDDYRVPQMTHHVESFYENAPRRQSLDDADHQPGKRKVPELSSWTQYEPPISKSQQQPIPWQNSQSFSNYQTSEPPRTTTTEAPPTLKPKSSKPFVYFGPNFQGQESSRINDEPIKKYQHQQQDMYKDSVLFKPAFDHTTPTTRSPLQDFPILKDNPLLPLPMPGYSAPDLYGKDVPRAKRKDTPTPPPKYSNDEYFENSSEYDDYDLEAFNKKYKNQKPEQEEFYPVANSNLPPKRKNPPPHPPAQSVMVRPYGEPSLPPVIQNDNHYRQTQFPEKKLPGPPPPPPPPPRTPTPPPPPPPRHYPNELMSSPTERPRPPRLAPQYPDVKATKKPYVPQPGHPGFYGGAPYLQTGVYQDKPIPQLKGGYAINLFNKRDGGYSIPKDFENKAGPVGSYRGQPNRSGPAPGPILRKQGTPAGIQNHPSLSFLFRGTRGGKSIGESDLPDYEE